MSVRRSTYTSYIYDRQKPEEKNELRYIQPVASPSNIFSVLITIVLQCCHRILFFRTDLRIVIYVVSLFAISIISNAFHVPESYFSDTKNVLNSYLVKFGWFWTLFLGVPFVIMTSVTYCCGKRNMVIKHITRLLIATANWYIFVSLFSYIENNYGTCLGKLELKDKLQCKLHGVEWIGLDISGHTFILIYSTLVLVEEARCAIEWEGLNDLIRNESYWRGKPDRPFGPLRDLSNADFIKLHDYYGKTLPYIRTLLVFLTALTIIWDFMLLTTILYFHSMPEKLFGSLTAIAVWFITYGIWYKIPNILPCSPGEGLFKYNVPNENKTDGITRKNNVPSFTGIRNNILSNERS